MTPNEDLRFHSAKIRDVLFTGFIGGDGPRLAALVDRHRIPQWTWLGGRAKICADTHGNWYVCKENLLERKIELRGFDREDAVALADAFGITIQSFDAAGDRKRDFTESLAWTGLKAWVANNQATAGAWADHDLHIKGWYEQAVAENSAASAP